MTLRLLSMLRSWHRKKWSQHTQYFCSQDEDAEFEAADVFAGGHVAGNREKQIVDPLIKCNLDRDARLRATQKRCERSLSGCHFLDSSHFSVGSDRTTGSETPVPTLTSYFACSNSWGASGLTISSAAAALAPRLDASQADAAVAPPQHRKR
jgi:hypothetical protein